MLMRYANHSFPVAITTFVLIILMSSVSCGPNSSPEGRMRLTVESLRQEMLDSMRKQHAAVLDTLQKIREELKTMKEAGK
jgi:hypothetical protein